MTDLEQALARVPLFAALPASALATLAGQMRRRRLPGGAAIVYRDDPTGALYLILSGRVKVHTSTQTGDDVLLTIKGPGDFFGEISLLDGQPRSADVSTLEPTEVALLDGADLRQTMEARPQVAWELLRALAAVLRAQNAQIEMLMTRDVAGRVAAFLLTLADKQGTLLEDGRKIRIDVGLTQSDIAASVGATRERVSRALTAFRAQKAILWDKDAGRWVVLNQTLLSKRAAM